MFTAPSDDSDDFAVSFAAGRPGAGVLFFGPAVFTDVPLLERADFLDVMTGLASLVEGARRNDAVCGTPTGAAGGLLGSALDCVLPDDAAVGLIMRAKKPSPVGGLELFVADPDETTLDSERFKVGAIP